MQRKIHVAYGGDILKTTRFLLEQSGAIDCLPEGASVALTPNLVVGRPADGGATTHIQIVQALIEFLFDHNRRDVTIIEGSWVGDDTRRAFAACGFDDISRRYGVPLFDLKRDSYTAVDTPIGKIKVCDRARGADCLVNLPVLKGHCQTVMTCALKNMKGCIPDSEKRRFHSLGLTEPIAALNTALRPVLHVVDGICGDLNFEEGGNPVLQERVFLGVDPVMIDAFGCSLMGVDPRDVGYIELAQHYGAGSMAFTPQDIVLHNQPQTHRSAMRQSGQVARLAKCVKACDACSACYGSLIHALARLDEEGLLGYAPKIAIGQGMRGVPFDGVGVGRCCDQAKIKIPGCPPSAAAILQTLRDQLK